MDAKLLNQLVFFPTPESPCSYLTERDSRSIFLHPEQSIDNNLYTQLNQLGFRRSGAHLYRPWCDHCQACQAVRVKASAFKLSRNQRRVLKRNHDLTVEWCQAENTADYYDLYQRYIEQRHADGDMYPPSEQQFDSFLCQPPNTVTSHFLCFKQGQRLLAVAVVDLLPDAASAIYTFYDPTEESRSLGKLSILWLINWARTQLLQHVYLGYWISDCQKMSYKSNYQPMEYFNGLQWLPMEPD
ncbi:MAG: arginyltransferase [Gammaproteobacteria bacterium]|jgi:arginine-tRNA-protein transferase|nr:arginyltransferase [Gammaproteobacteria bacterium]